MIVHLARRKQSLLSDRFQSFEVCPTPIAFRPQIPMISSLCSGALPGPLDALGFLVSLHASIFLELGIVPRPFQLGLTIS